MLIPPLTWEERMYRYVHAVKVLQPYEVEVGKVYRTRRQQCLYPMKCFQKAMRYLLSKMQIEGLKLLIGMYDPDIDEVSYRGHHVWVELPNDIVFDGVLQRFYSKSDYYIAYKIEKIAEYTPQEAVATLIKQGCDGKGDFDFIFPDEVSQKIHELEEMREHELSIAWRREANIE